MKRQRPFGRNFRCAADHADDRADRRAVAVGVEAALDGQADRTPKIAAAVQERGRHDRGVGDRMAPIVRRTVVITAEDIVKAGFKRSAGPENVQNARDLLV